MSGVVHSVNANPEGGVPKPPVGSTMLLTEGVEGDKQNDLKHHGGPRRAVCLFALERINALQKEGHPIDVGTTGENLTTEGLDWDLLKPGMELAIGGAILELTKTAPPCSIIADSFSDGDSKRIAEEIHSGWSRWYAAVVNEGVVCEGDSIVIL